MFTVPFRLWGEPAPPNRIRLERAAEICPTVQSIGDQDSQPERGLALLQSAHSTPSGLSAKRWLPAARRSISWGESADGSGPNGEECHGRRPAGWEMVAAAGCRIGLQLSARVSAAGRPSSRA